MDLQQLKYFITSAREGSLTKAAEVLYTSQPHVSQVIKALENDLGIKLFHRSASGITLTSDGERIFFYANNMLKNAELITDISKDSASRSLRIAANPSSSLAFVLEDFFHKIQEDGVTLQYTECGIEEMMSLLQNRRYDLGLLFVPVNKMTAFSYMTSRHHLLYTPLRTTDLVVHAGKKSPFYGRTSVKPKELNGCSCIQLEDDFFSVEDLLLEDKDFQSGKYAFQKVIRTNSDHLMIRTLQQTDLCNIGSYWLQKMYGEYHFSLTRIEGFEQQVSFGYLHIDNHLLSKEAHAFKDELQRIIAEDQNN